MPKRQQQPVKQAPATGGGRTPPQGQKPKGSGLGATPPPASTNPRKPGQKVSPEQRKENRQERREARQEQRRANQRVDNPYLAKPEDRLYNTALRTDQQLGQAAQDQFGQAVESMEQPVDWGQFDQVYDPNYEEIAPAFNPDDWNQWRQQQIDASAQDFERQFGKRFQQQEQDLQQQLTNRGIPMGSELWNNQMKELREQQEGQRQSNMVQAMNLASSNAAQFGNLAMQARDQGFGEQMSRYGQSVQERQRQQGDYFQQRYNDLSEANMLRGAQSPLLAQNMQYARQAQLQQQQADAATRLKYMGLQAGAAGGYRGTGLPYQDVLAMETASQIAVNAADPRYQQGKSPSPWWGAAGGILGGVAGAAADYYFS